MLVMRCQSDTSTYVFDAVREELAGLCLYSGQGEIVVLRETAGPGLTHEAVSVAFDVVLQNEDEESQSVMGVKSNKVLGPVVAKESQFQRVDVSVLVSRVSRVSDARHGDCNVGGRR
jgi:hypothetical protein